MDRFELLKLLDRYEERHPDEQATLTRFRKLLAERDRAFHRDCFMPGHITTSAWIVSRESGAALFTHHRKLERWLQLGGHADGETDVQASALREAEEESGLSGFVALPLTGHRNFRCRELCVFRRKIIGARTIADLSNMATHLKESGIVKYQVHKWITRSTSTIRKMAVKRLWWI